MRPLKIIAAAEPFPIACPEELPMRIFRHIGAAYETGDADCWDAAHARAEEALGRVAGPLLVARATSILRLIRVDRSDFCFLPTPCRSLSRDETALLGLLRAARSGLPPLAAAGHILDDLTSIRLLAVAACALAGHDVEPMSIGIPLRSARAGACMPLHRFKSF